MLKEINYPKFQVPGRGSQRSAQIAVEMLFLAALIVILTSGFVSLAASFLQLSVRGQNQLQAFAIAEAGIDYYRWHLSYATQDYTDGTGGHAGPYVHPYYDGNGNAIGQFSLTITPPPIGSTIVTVQSAGTVFADPSIQKVIRAQFGIASFAQFAWVLNDDVYFGSTAQVFGVIYTNAGVHFDGTAHNLVESALTTYTDPDNSKNEWAVYTDGPPADPQPPTALSPNATVFQAGRALGVPAVDFAGITADLASIKSQAQASGTYFGSSTVFGYDLALATTSYTVYKVTALMSAPGGCTNALNQTGWGTWTVKTESQFATGTIPQSGSMFFEDNLWVRGHINGVRVAVASGRFPANPATYSNIMITTSTVYGNFNGSDTLALISQNNITVGLQSDNNLTVDAALMAQNGWVGRYYYSSNCGSAWQRNSLTTLGIMGSNLRSAFAYGDGSGFNTRTYNFDSNLLYAPPPNFPLTTNQYSLLSWKELQ